MKNLFVLIVGLSIHSVSVAGWRVETKVDAITDETKKAAVVQNESGHTFSVYRLSKDGPVWGTFALPVKASDQVDWEKPPVFRIDKNKPTDLAMMKRYQNNPGIHAYSWESKQVNFLLWHGKEDQGISKSIENLMEGKKVVFRYFLKPGGHKDTTFTLEGAAPAISKAIDISAHIDHTTQQQLNEYKQAVSAETMKCSNDMDTFKSCFSHVTQCSNQSNNNPQKFKSCINSQ